MDEGLREAIALATQANHDVKRPLAIEVLIDTSRRCQGIARRAQGFTVAKRCMKLAVKAGRDAAPYLRPGGELRERLLSGELMSEEEWERLCGPTRY